VSRDGAGSFAATTVSANLVGTASNATSLNNQTASYYLDYNNFTNTPIIGNGTISIVGNSGLTGSGTFSLNQTGNATITVSHQDTSTVSNVATSSGVFVSGLSFDTYGHVTGVNTASGGANAFGTISVSGQTALVAASPNDILTVAAGTNITLSTDNITKTLTINASSGGTAASAFGVISIAGQDTVSADDPGDTLTLVAGNGIILTSSASIDSVTISHEDTSNVATLTASTDIVVSGLAFDEFGHVTGLSTASITISDATVNILSGAGLTGSGSFTLNQINDPLLPSTGLLPSSSLYPDGEISITLSLDINSIRITGFTSTGTSSWISTTDGGFSFKKDVAIANVTASDYPEVHFNLSTYSIAQDAIISYVDAYAGGITLYSKFLPTNTVSFDYIILKG
jgi:hypothetical protein